MPERPSGSFRKEGNKLVPNQNDDAMAERLKGRQKGKKQKKEEASNAEN